jgi:putative transposase
MPRPNLIRSETHPYHITSRCNNKEFFPIPLDDVWSIMMKLLERLHRDHGLAIHAFVLMGNHFHLLCHTPRANIDECMHLFMRQTSLEINRRNSSQNHLWGGRYRWSLIEAQRYYYQVYRYIYQNPLRAKIVNRVEDYPFSTLMKSPPFPLHSSLSFSFGGAEGEKLWLNEKYDEEDLNLIKLGLKKSQFSVDKRKLKALNKLSFPPEGGKGT